jgi:hypothetical protein
MYVIRSLKLGKVKNVALFFTGFASSLIGRELIFWVMFSSTMKLGYT